MIMQLDVPVEFLRWPPSIREGARVCCEVPESAESGSPDEQERNHETRHVTGPSVISSLDGLAEVNACNMHNINIYITIRNKLACVCKEKSYQHIWNYRIYEITIMIENTHYRKFGTSKFRFFFQYRK